MHIKLNKHKRREVMMKAKKQVVILVACGSGIATSTLAADAIKDICDEIGIDAVIKKSNMSEILTKAQDVDVVFTTNKYSETLPVPSLSVTSLITGIGEDEIRKKCKELLSKIAENV